MPSRSSPFLWGLLGSAGFYALIHGGPLGLPLVQRYFTHHPVEYMETVMFAVGLAALMIKAFDIVAQRAGLGIRRSGRQRGKVNRRRSATPCWHRLDRLPGRRQGEYYVARLRAALEHVRHRGSAESLDDELKYLSDLDAARLHAGYGLFRVIVWAIPILGFLGTVIGITMMLTGAAQMASGPDQSSMFKVFEGLGLKFDTTALALTLSMVLMFVHFFVERAENSLLEQVDRPRAAELAGRFAAVPAGADGQVVAMRRMAETMLQATEVLVRRQAELWQASVDSAAARWAQMADTAGERLGTAPSAALSESLKTHAQHWLPPNRSPPSAAASNGTRRGRCRRRACRCWAPAGELTRQAEVLRRAVEAAGEVTRLEDALNRNLTALAGAKHFEQTVLSLAAAVNMLSVRLAETPSAPVKLEPPRRTAHAA